MTPYQFSVWKRKIAMEKRKQECRLKELRDGIAKYYQKVR